MFSFYFALLNLRVASTPPTPFEQSKSQERNK